jgi:phage gpG-like protein
MSEAGVEDASLRARLSAIETSLAAALDAKVAALGADLKARIDAKLSGEVLANKSGALLASLALEPAIEADTILTRVVLRGVPYARIQEFGGRTQAHDIVAVKAKALAFVAGGKAHYAKSAHHPGSVIPERSFMHSSLDEMRDEIGGELGDAVIALMRGA